MTKRRSRRKLSLSSDKCPEFFKIYIPEQSSQRLHIPPAFMKHFNGSIPNKAILKDLTGSFWHVELKKVENGLFIQDGWQEFVSDRSLEMGDFLLFRYNGNYIFDVRIFGRNGCKKEDALAIDTYVKKEDEPEAGQPCTKPTRVCKRKYSGIGLKGIETSSGSLEVSQYRSKRTAAVNVEPKVFEAAGFVAPKNPHFLASVNQATPYNLNIPRKLVVQNDIKMKPEMTFRDQNGKKWPVKVCFRKDGRIAVTTGWMNFWKENNLGTEDKCLFEFLLGRGRISKEIQVQILRAGARNKKCHQYWTRRQP